MESLFKVGVAYVPQLSIKQLFRSGIPIYISFDDDHPKLLNQRFSIEEVVGGDKEVPAAKE